MIKPMNMLERSILAEQLFEIANKNKNRDRIIREMEELIKENEHAAAV